MDAPILTSDFDFLMPYVTGCNGDTLEITMNVPVGLEINPDLVNNLFHEASMTWENRWSAPFFKGKLKDEKLFDYILKKAFYEVDCNIVRAGF